jgi:aspartate aminotransferase
VEEVAAFVRRRGLAVISDEAYEDLIYEGEPSVTPASLPGMYERTITVYTLSKSYSMTGWRLGYVIAPRRYQSAIRTVVLYTTNGVSTPTQWAAVEALGRGTEFLEDWRAGYRARRDRLAAGLNAAGFELESPRAALYLFAKTPSWLGGDSREAARTLLDGAKIATVPGIVFGPEGEGYLRFSFSVPEEMIAGGVEALAAFAHASAGRS